MFCGIFALLIRCWQKVSQGSAIVRNGMGGTKVSFSGMIVIPGSAQVELMDISVKRIEIDRSGEDGLICKDNIRADIKVVFLRSREQRQTKTSNALPSSSVVNVHPKKSPCEPV